MQKITKILLYAGMIALLMSACSKNDSDPEEPSDNKAEFLTFGFYAADNAELDKDYLAENIAREITIRLPEEIDRSALVARFTTSEDDVVTIGNVEQKSGITSNDFSNPVDYLVSDSKAKLSTPYTVVVRKELVMKWEHLTTYAEPGFLTTTAYQAKVAPDNTLYMVYTRTTEEEGNDGQRASVVKLSNGTFQAVGKTGFSEGRARVPAITIDPSGVPSVFFVDGANSDFATAMTYTSGSWSIMGSHSFAGKPSTSYLTAMGYDPSSKNPIVAFHLNAAITGGLARRELDLSYWSGNSWDADNTIAELAGMQVLNPVMINTENDLYLGCAPNAAGAPYYLFKYAGAKTWTKIDAFLPNGAGRSSIVGLALDVASNGDIYICAGFDEDEAGVYKPSVYRYRLETKTWSRIGGGAIPLTLKTASKYTMALDSDDNPVVLFREQEGSQENMPMLLTLDTATGNWNSPVQLGNTPAANAELTLAYGTNGVGYAVILVDDAATDKKFEVYRHALDTDE